MATVFCADQKQVSLPHPGDHGETLSKQDRVVRFDPKTRTADVSEAVADELVRLFPNSVFVVPDPPKAKAKS